MAEDMGISRSTAPEDIMANNGTYHGDATLSIGKPQHLTSAEVAEEIQNSTGENGEICDGAAAAIASWYQTPNGVGLAFAQLASTGNVGLEALADALSHEFSQPNFAPELNYLATWALNHPSRSDKQ